jgi:hypothetical protein
MSKISVCGVGEVMNMKIDLSPWGKCMIEGVWEHDAGEIFRAQKQITRGCSELQHKELPNLYFEQLLYLMH